MFLVTDNVGSCYVNNGEVLRADAGTIQDVSIDESAHETVIYEVIRYIDGVGLFKCDHYARLKQSARSEGITLPLDEDVYDSMASKLLEANGYSNCNIKLLVYSGMYVMYINKNSYLPMSCYSEGVITVSVSEERPNPNAKVRREGYIRAIEEAQRKANAFEALLVNREGVYTEGSKSNLFFIKKGENRFYTAPPHMILEGISRAHILRVCDDIGYEVIQEPLPQNELCNVEAAFLTGTSIKVLPIAKIDSMLYNSSDNRAVQSLMKRFDEYIGQSLRNS